MDRRILAILAIASQCGAASQWRLVSEISTIVVANSHSYTAFSYTANGQLELSRIWNGIDSSIGSAIKTESTTWDSKGRRSIDVVFSKSDTVALTIYAYGSNDSLVAQSVYLPGGVLSSVDSFTYSPQLSGQVRHDGSGALVLAHHFGRDVSNHLVSDSLFIGSQSTLHAVTRTSWANGQATGDTTYTYSGAGPTPTNATVLEYQGSLLRTVVHLVPYGDVLDSLTHSYDASGNLAADTSWSGGSISSTVSYLWVQISTTALSNQLPRSGELQRIGSDVVLSSMSGTNSILDIYAPSGRLVASLSGIDRWTLPALPAGRNFARLRGRPASPIAL